MTAHGPAEEAYDHWSRLHGGLDPRTSAWVAGWVRLSHACARPLARRGVHPDTVTVLGVLLTAGVPALAALGAAWPLAATLVLVVAAVLDGVDGALAAQTGTDSAWGRVLDPLADRCSDVLLLAALGVLGAPWPLVVALWLLVLLPELARALGQAAGMTGPGVVSVWERPTRVIVAAFGSGLVGLEWVARRAGLDVLAAVDGEAIATTAAGAGAALAVVGTLQVLRAVRRQLR
jgi:CDP-diacylglycerol--glycerol-3-phosphate 3-phosphatidyltransferase